MDKPQILLWDLETLPNICYAFDLFSYKKPDMIIKEKAIVSMAWKWLGEDETHVMVTKEPYEDKELVNAACELINRADYVIAHFGDRFDTRFLRSRALYHRLTPPAPTPTIDTYKLAKKYFHLNANRLDYLGEFLKVGRKQKTDWKLWADCAAGKKSAIDEMAAYNRQDVLLLESVFLAMLPYVDSKLNHNLFSDVLDTVCHSCGSKHVQKRGFLVNKITKRQRFQCLKCGSWFSERIKKDDNNS